MSELALWIVRTGFLVVLWIFIFSIISVIRSDLFGQKVVNKVAEAKAPKVVSAPIASTSVPGTMTGAIGGLAAAAQAPQSASSVATKLVITEGERTGHTLRLDRREITIGRSSDSDLVINDDYASTHHAKLVQVENDWVIQDLNSTNGTFLAGSRVGTPASVKVGTPIRIGKTTFELRA
jgi:hypothetical protein